MLQIQSLRWRPIPKASLPGHLRNESPNASVYLIALKAYTFHWGTYSETVRLRPYWQLTPTDTHWIW